MDVIAAIDDGSYILTCFSPQWTEDIILRRVIFCDKPMEEIDTKTVLSSIPAKLRQRIAEKCRKQDLYSLYYCMMIAFGTEIWM